MNMPAFLTTVEINIEADGSLKPNQSQPKEE